jgi:hypothetical protein
LCRDPFKVNKLWMWDKPSMSKERKLKLVIHLYNIYYQTAFVWDSRSFAERLRDLLRRWNATLATNTVLASAITTLLWFQIAILAALMGIQF